MIEPVELKHGPIKARLLFCNRAYRDARHELGDFYSIQDFTDSVKQLNFMISYLYNSYLVYCKSKREPVLIEWHTFDETISAKKIPESESNLKEISGLAADSIQVYFSDELENIKKKMEEMGVVFETEETSESQPTTNSSNSSVDNLGTDQTSSGTDSTGDKQTT